ncbi:hypothetical protein N477_20800 [Pseudoalteromonas luteoviolacea H33-S]|nr:hypothetical protein N477_20800 [Pseudoalteromonas luteoviolacea H33-S]
MCKSVKLATRKLTTSKEVEKTSKGLFKVSKAMNAV